MREHGTRARYVNGPDENDATGKPCRCDLCRAANAADASRTYRLRAYGQWQPYVDAQPAREHVQNLIEAGIKLKRIGRLAGLDPRIVARLINGIPSRGVAPSKRLRAATAQALLAVDSSLERMPGRARVDATGTRRRLQALVAIGWSQRRLANRLGLADTSVHLIIGAAGVQAETARRVRALYDELWDQPAPDGQSATVARAYARNAGWLPPMAWDDDLIDVPDDRLEAELANRAAAMSTAEVARCNNGYRNLGDPSPLIRAGAREYDRRRHSSVQAVSA